MMIRTMSSSTRVKPFAFLFFRNFFVHFASFIFVKKVSPIPCGRFSAPFPTSWIKPQVRIKTL